MPVEETMEQWDRSFEDSDRGSDEQRSEPAEPFCRSEKWAGYVNAGIRGLHPR
jgi:hypothetical protein